MRVPRFASGKALPQSMKILHPLRPDSLRPELGSSDKARRRPAYGIDGFRRQRPKPIPAQRTHAAVTVETASVAMPLGEFMDTYPGLPS